MTAQRQDMPILLLCDMAARHVGLTKPLADCYCEAARVCLSRHHESPTVLTLAKDPERLKATVSWTHPDDREKRAWGNDNDCTEAGAYACAIAAAEVTEGLYVVGRAEARSGADFYLARQSERPHDFETCIRLEVAGRDSEGPSAIDTCLRQKLHQLMRGEAENMALAAVVGFGASLIRLAYLDQPE